MQRAPLSLSVLRGEQRSVPIRKDPKEQATGNKVESIRGAGSLFSERRLPRRRHGKPTAGPKSPEPRTHLRLPGNGAGSSPRPRAPERPGVLNPPWLCALAGTSPESVPAAPRAFSRSLEGPRPGERGPFPLPLERGAP